MECYQIIKYADLLPEFYDDWVLQKRDELRERYIELLLRVVEHYRAQSEYALAIEWAQRVLQADRANERAHQHLIFLYAALGDRTAALNQFESCVLALDEELGVEPSAETIALAKKIKQQKVGAASEATRLTNLPKPVTSFVGREKEIEEIRAMLGGARREEQDAHVTPRSALLTLTGAGGSGKTRLAIETGRALIDEYEHGVWWVELAPLSDAALVPQQIAKALGVQEQPNVLLIETLIDFLRARELLLILDNCEHLVAACADIANHLLTQSPNISLLATSREGLNVPGEQIYPVAPLAVPTTADGSPITEFSAVRLFIERARLAQPQFGLDDANAPYVIQICQRLDGIPLAIELAAARVKQLDVREIAARLDARFDLLVGARTALPRQQTLRALIDWSYDLLPEQEKTLFRRLSVFAGGWTIKSAEQICADDVGAMNSSPLPRAKILDALLRLVDKSLVTRMDGDDTRYTMLETIREYAHEKLDAADDTANVRAQHLNYFLNFAEQADNHWMQGDATWFTQLDLETDNLRVALDTSFAAENGESALRLTGALADYWYRRGKVNEAGVFLERALRLPQNGIAPQVLGKVYTGAGTIAWVRGEINAALPLHQTAFAFYRIADDRRGMSNAQHNIGVMHNLHGAYAHGRDAFEKALALTDITQDSRLRERIMTSLGVSEGRLGNAIQAQYNYEQVVASARANQHQDALAFALLNLGCLARERGDFSRALALFDESLWLAEQIGHTFLSSSNLVEKGRLYNRMSRWGEARACFQQVLIQAQESQRKTHTTRALAGLAVCLGQAGKPLLAVRLFAAAEGLRNKTGLAWEPEEAGEYAERIETMRTGMEQAQFDAAWAVGETLTIEQAIELSGELAV